MRPVEMRTAAAMSLTAEAGLAAAEAADAVAVRLSGPGEIGRASCRERVYVLV